MTRVQILDETGFDVSGASGMVGNLQELVHPNHLRRKINKANEIALLWEPRPKASTQIINNPDIESRIIKLYKEHYTLYELADWFRVSRHSIRGILGKAHIKARRFGPRLTFYEWENKKAQYHYRCAYCGKKPRLLTKDHIIALAAGGDDSIDNIVPACITCNKSKNKRALLDWKKFKVLQLSL